MAMLASKAATRAFVCRKQPLINLTDEQAALAHGGIISKGLRRQSTVYYWRMTRQHNSHHEAVCKKRVKWHLITFGSHGRFSFLADQRCSMNAHKLPYVDSCVNNTLASLPEPWKAAHNVSKVVRGAGYWKWKPYLILQRLREIGDGEVLVHVDYDLLLNHDPKALYCLGQNAKHGVAAFHMPCLTDRAWTKRELADAFNATDAMLDTTQIYGGIVILRKTYASRPPKHRRSTRVPRCTRPRV